MSGSDYFYSKSTGLYVSRKPLKIDARVKEASTKADIEMDWDDEGIINNIDFDNSKKLLEQLDSRMLTPKEYWLVYKDALNQDDKDMISQLTSNKYTEWLDRVYTADKIFIDNPKIIGRYIYDGDKLKSGHPTGRPGWFNPENNISELGEPVTVDVKREKFSQSWKYWSPDLTVTKLGYCAPIRGYVTSVGKPSFDLGIPVDSRQPKLMIREARDKPLSLLIDESIIEQSSSSDIIEFVEKYGELFSTSKDSLIYKLRESFFDRLGDVALEKDISKAVSKINPSNIRPSFEDFEKFVRNSSKSLEVAINEKKDLVFVMGHKNPDTDTVISSLFEAYRNSLIDNTAAYIPIVQSDRMPDEISRLLGDISKSVVLHNNPLYLNAKSSGLARWISVDQNREPEVQKFFISIIDHHRVTESAKNLDVAKTLEMLGSTAALITRKYLGMGFELDYGMARLLYGAALMDTENRVTHKMTPKDYKIMDYLKKVSGVNNDDEMYGDLMSYLLNTDDAELLFKRDYKEDWGFGFAVTKIKNGFDKQGTVLKQNLIERLVDLTHENNIRKNLPLTLLKVTDYESDNERVNRERVYFIFNNADKKFVDSIRDALKSIVMFEFPDDNIAVNEQYIEFWGTGMQLSRKKTAPVIEPINHAFNKYFYSPSVNMWIKREFLKKTAKISGEYSVDEYGRINYITFEEAKKISEENNFSMLSLKDYWIVLNDAKKIKDSQMIESLQGSNFVEFLDTRIINRKTIIHHDKEEQDINVPQGNPGLIHPDDIDLSTGLPKNVRPPNEYGNPELWRYWQPDTDEVIPCRSFIFLLDQPCLDMKFHPGESFPNLGIRPMIKSVVYPEVSMSIKEQTLAVQIEDEDDTKTYNWPKNIWDSIDSKE